MMVSSISDEVGGLRIIIVEDEAPIVEEMSDRLRRAGCEVVATPNTGEAAMEAAIARRPDLILMNVRLKGGMDGIRAAELIHQHLSVPIVYLTEHSDHGTLRRVKSNGVFSYIQKPVHFGYLVSAINRTLDRFNTERQLEENLLTYATILNNSTDGVIATDVHDRVRFMNPAAERLTGWSIRAARGQPSRAVLRFAPTARPADDHAVSQVLLSRGTVKLGTDQYLMCRFGGYVPVAGAMSAVIDSLDRLVGATISLRDVTDARNQTAALRDAVAQLRAVMDTAVDGVMLLDAAGKILMFNAACSRLFGYARQEVAGINITAIIPDVLTDDLDWPLRQGHDNTPTRGKNTTLQTTGRRKDGSSFPAELSLGKASHGGRAVFVSVIRDVSERKELEAALLDAIGHEQRRLGDDLHDGLGQELTGLALLLSAYARGVRQGQNLEATDLERAEQIARRALKSCRDLAHGLSPVTEAQGGLIAGLRELVARLKIASGPSLYFETFGRTRLRLSPVASDHLFRIAQEALANALRHADAKSISVRLDIKPSSVRLEVCDDGKGLTIPRISATGLGLRTMRYRASVLGARFHITQSAPSGTCIVCECPQAVEKTRLSR